MEDKKWNEKTIDDRRREANDRARNVETEATSIVTKYKDQLKHQFSNPKASRPEKKED